MYSLLKPISVKPIIHDLKLRKKMSPHHSYIIIHDEDNFLATAKPETPTYFPKCHQFISH